MIKDLINKELILKSIIYRCVAIFAIIIISLIYTKNLYIASIIGISDLFLKIVLYYLYELIWKRLKKVIKKGKENDK